MRIFFIIFTALSVILNQNAKGSESTAKLLLNLQSVKKGEEIIAGVHIKLLPEWHIYWVNPGESGAPPKIQWKLPDGFQPGEPLYEKPIKHTLGGVTSYIIENETILIVPIKTSSNLPEGEYVLKAEVEWLECKEICRPASAKIQNKIILGNQNIPSSEADLINKWIKKIPTTNILIKAIGKWEKLGTGDNKYQLILDINCKYPISDFFPYPDNLIDIDTQTIVEKLTPDEFRIKKNATLLGTRLPSQIGGVFTLSSTAPGGIDSFEVRNIPVSSIISEKTPSISTHSINKISFWVAMYLAFLGGIILNFMPCVLPVISLKILGFINQASMPPKKIRLMGLAFAAGVVASLLILALFVVLIQQAGKLAGWGMQFQSPTFIILITILVTLIALNLFGIFEISFSGKAMDKAAGLASQQGIAGSFFHGALVVILATPCTAPFLGAALGYAFTQPPAKIFSIFISIALGLSLPYTVISMFPSTVKILPRPGDWMTRFKIIMGFPMLATAMWLLSVAFSHYGNKTGWIGIFLVIISLASWLYGEYYQRNRKIFSGIILPLLLITAGYFYILEYEIDWRHSKYSKFTQSAYPSKYGINWQTWSPEAVEKARNEGKVVLVDFTAEWCLTCKANMKTSLDTESVSAKLKQIGAVAFIADYTLKDERITAELRKYNRAGVPLVLVYPGNKQSEPIILPEVLTPSIVLEALEKATQ